MSYEERVRKLESEGMTTSDAQAVADAQDVPEGMEQEHFDYLDNLRESGVTNMYGAGEYLMVEFQIRKNTATKYLCHWMETFSRRQKGNGND